MIKSVLEKTYQAADTEDSEVNQANLTRNLTFLSHQIVVIMKSLKLPFCTCGSCTEHLGYEQANLSASETRPLSVNGFGDEGGHEPGLQTTVPCEEGGSLTEAGESMEPEILDRRHKHYGSRKEREEIAKCGRLYGTRTAAKKYNIPLHSVRYYVRTMTDTVDSIRPRLKPKLSRLLPAPTDNGKRRGRPCILGERLEASLLEHLLDVKNSSPDGQLSVQQTSKFAKEFLQANAPEALAENGGNARMSYSWVISLLKRLQENEGEQLAESTSGAPYLGRKGNHNNKTSMTEVEKTSELAGADGQCSSRNASRISSPPPSHPNKELLLSGTKGRKQSRRGRPSLLSEDIEKKLWDHLIQLEYTSPGALRSSSEMLLRARNFLRENAPELLAENGGSLRLSYAWATGMRKRIASRIGEVEMPNNERSRSSSHISEKDSPGAQRDPADVDLYRDVPSFTCGIKMEPGSLFS